jgi:predicted RNA-binding protein YlxR (DUF448 family)
VGCRERAAQAELLRLVIDEEGCVAVDLRARSFGRGAWIHARLECIERAPRGIAASFKTSVSISASALHAELVAAAERRVLGLVAAARRAGKLVLGAKPVEKVLDAGEACLIVVATDARAAADTKGVSDAVAAGRAVAFGTKDQLGKSVGRDQIGVAAVIDAGLARAIAQTVAIAQIPAPRGRRSERDRKDRRVDE